MWIHRLARLTTTLILAARIAGCATHTAQQPLAGLSVPAVAPGTAQLATSVGGAQPSSDPLPVGSDDPVWGAATAPVTLLEFSDLQCPFCARVQPTIKALQAKYGPNQLRVVFKHNPLSFHEHALPAAKVADAVLHQGGSSAFFAFLDLAFEEQLTLGDEALSAWVARLDVGQKADLLVLLDCADGEGAARIASLLAELRSSLDALPLDPALAGIAKRIEVSRTGARLRLGLELNQAELSATLDTLLGP